MMVVMTPEATTAQIDAVVAKLEARGVHAKVMPGELTTAIGAIGDPEGVRELGLEGLPGVDQVIPISRPYKLASSELSHHEPTSFAVDGRTVGGGETLLPDRRAVHRRVAASRPRAVARAVASAAARRCCAAAPSSRAPRPSRSRASATRRSRSSTRCAPRPACRW